MPGLLKSPETRVALCPQPQNPEISNQNQPHDGVPQPRQPGNMEGLLRFAMEASLAEDAPAGPSNFNPMDEDRRSFLEDALKAMTIDVTEVLLKEIKVFDNVDSVDPNGPAEEYINAFYTIMEYIDNIDIANDFYKIGGFAIFEPCLRSAHPKIRGGACELLGELCQNNPFCQMIVVDQGLLTKMLAILDTDQDNDICVKALHGTSCCVRGYMEGCSKFIALNALEVILDTIKKPHDKLRTKSAFFLNALCNMRLDIVEKIVSLDFIPVLIEIISGEHLPSQEHILSLLKMLVENSTEAAEVCRDPTFNLRSILEGNLNFVKDKEEYYEECEYCQQILNLLYPGWDD